MASAMTCDMCQAEPATSMQTNLANGDTIAIGDSCAFAFFLTTVQTMAEAMPSENLAEYAGALLTVLQSLEKSLETVADQAEPYDNPVTGMPMVPEATETAVPDGQ